MSAYNSSAPSPQSNKSQTPRVAEIVTRYLTHCQKTGVHSEISRQQRAYTLGLFVEKFGEMLVSECKPFMLTDWIESQPRVESSSTRKSWGTSVNAVFNWALKQGRIDKNPFYGVTYPEAEPRPPLDDDALFDLLACSNKRFERAVRFLRLTGCRLSEMCGLTWIHVDLEKGVAHIERHKSRKKTRKAKVLVLVPEVVALLRSIRDSQPLEYAGTVFLNNRGTPWNRRTLGQTLSRMKRRGEIHTDASLHGLRHAYGQAALTNGASLALVAQALGHSSPVVTFKYYGHLRESIEAVREAASLAKPRSE